MVDTLMYFKKLEAVGFSRQQAEVQIEMVNEVTINHFATKQDLKDLEYSIDRRFIKLESDMARLGDRITIRLGGMMIVGFSAMAALIKIF